MARIRPYFGLEFQAHALNTFSENGSGEQEAFLKMEDAYNELQEPLRFRSNSAHKKQPRPESGLGCLIKGVSMFS